MFSINHTRSRRFFPATLGTSPWCFAVVLRSPSADLVVVGPEAEGHVLMMVPPMNAFVFAPAPLRRDEDENAVRSGEEESASESAPPSALVFCPHTAVGPLQ